MPSFRQSPAQSPSSLRWVNHLLSLGHTLLPFQPLNFGTQPPKPHLARGLHPLEDTEEHDDPGQQQAEAEVPANLPRLANALASLNVQDIAAVGDNNPRILWSPCHTPCPAFQAQ